jgi:ParB-like chromosome segregation protein Spo0J
MDYKHVAQNILKRTGDLVKHLEALPFEARMETINSMRKLIHEASPRKREPVDCVLWVPLETVAANDYNPNSVAPPEMQLLQVSILQDGYTQPIVAWGEEGQLEVIDGFHRNRVGRECKEVAERIKGYLPVVVANQDRTDRGDRIAATIRHNRARGKHRVDSMSEIVVELKRRNWSEEKIGRELGMEPDEVLRLCQVSGLVEMFSNQEFSQSWETDEMNELDVVALEDNPEPEEL